MLIGARHIKQMLCCYELIFIGVKNCGRELLKIFLTEAVESFA